MKSITIFFLVLIFGSASLLVYSSMNDFNPIQYSQDKKFNVEFSIQIEEIDNIFSSNSLDVEHSYRVLDEVGVLDYVQMPRVLSIGADITSVEFTSTLISDNGQTYKQDINVGDFSFFKDTYVVEFNQILPSGEYTHTLDFSFKEDNNYQQHSITKEVTVQ